MVFLYGIKCVCFYISVSIMYTLEIKRTFSVLWKKYRIFMRGQLRRIPSWSIFSTIKEDITWVLIDLSLRDKVCLFLNILLYHIYISEEDNTFPFYKKKCCNISLRDQPERILSWSIFRTTQDQTCITCFLLGLSLRELCLFLQILLYHINIIEKDKRFPFCEKNAVFLAGPT